jgi:hypothetical protein
VASATLPLTQLAGLTALDQPQSSGVAPATAAFLLQLAWAPGAPEAACQAPGSVAMLQVRVGYSAVNCYSLEEEEEEGQEEAGGDDGRQLELGSTRGTQQDGTAATPGSRKASPAKEASNRPQHHQQQQSSSSPGDVPMRDQGRGAAASPASPAPGSSSLPTSPPQLAGPGGQQKVASPTSPPVEGAMVSVEGTGGRPGQGGALQLAAYHSRRAAAAAAGGPPPLAGELCVEIIRACGLQVGLEGRREALGQGMAACAVLSQPA